MRFVQLICGVTLSLCSCLALADDGLNDLKRALKQLQNNTVPIMAELSSSFTEQHDDEIKQGAVSVLLNDNPSGFSLTYNSNYLEKMALEKQAKAQDENTLSPTLDAASKLKAIDLHRALAASTDFLQFIAKGEYISEKLVKFNDQNIRLLSFELPMEAIISNKRTREYVDDFTANYQVWIDDAGIPLKSHLAFNGRGSAYLVLSVEAYGQNTEFYQLINQRLVIVNSESKHGSKSFFGDFERYEKKVVNVIKQKSS